MCFTEVGLVAKQKWVKANRDLTANSRFPLVIGTNKTTNTCGILKLKFDKYWNNLHTMEKTWPILKIDFQGKHQLSRHQSHSTDTCWEMEQSVYKGVRLMLSRIIIYKRQIDMIMIATCWVVIEQSEYLISFECQRLWSGVLSISYHGNELPPQISNISQNCD